MRSRGEDLLHYGLYVPNFGRAAHPRVLAKLAMEAEKSGWDGFFLWDHLVEWDKLLPIYESFTSLAAMALSTERVRIGTTVTPLPKSKPWIVAGQTATLGSLATLTELEGQTEIRRENLQRDVAVTARLEGLDLGSGMAAVRNAVAALKLPSAIRVEYGGTYKEQQRSFRDLVMVLVLALVLVFLVLLLEFGSFSAPVAILSSALLSTSGVFFALLITRTTFNISSFMGLIMVIGIVAKNGILLLDADQKFRAVGFSAEEAMVQAGRRRLRPIVMTALAAVAGMLPLALAVGAGSQMLQPLAIAVIGGILISMVLSLIITPAMHFYMTKEGV